MRAFSFLAAVGLALALSACGDGSTEPESPALATHCTGALPQFCEICADGNSVCAHFDENCNIVTCTATN